MTKLDEDVELDTERIFIPFPLYQELTNLLVRSLDHDLENPVTLSLETKIRMLSILRYGATVRELTLLLEELMPYLSACWDFPPYRLPQEKE